MSLAPLLVREARKFEAQYAKESGITVERLRELGRIVAPCRCGISCCPGWQSIGREAWESDEKYRARHGGLVWTWPQ